MLKVIKRFGEHGSFYLQGEYMLIDWEFLEALDRAGSWQQL
jgi:hypothetical protein